MKAVMFTRYGSPETLQIKETEKPVAKKNEVLIKIYATAVNDYDWSVVRGKPYIYRLIFGLLKPKKQIPGMELSGIVEAVGPGTTLFKPGDAVYGDISAYGFGSFAAYIAINEKAVIKKPEQMSFEDAASIPHASLLAQQALHTIGKLKQQQKILINGAGGGVGSFALQIAKLQQCEVTGVDTGDKLEMMKANGFDHVLDYKKTDFTKTGERFDMVLDCKTTRSPFAYLRSLKPGGHYITIGGSVSRLLQVLVLRKIINLLSGKKLSILSLQSNKGIEDIETLYIQRKLKCTIDGPYPLQDAPKLIQHFGEGKHKGKIIMKV